MQLIDNPRTVTGFISGDRYRSAEETAERVQCAATVLDRFGVGQGDRIAIMLRNDFPFVEASYAAATLGAIAVPINWHYRGAEVSYILEDSEAKLVVVHADLLDRVPGGAEVLVVDTPPEIAAAYGIERGTGGPSWDAEIGAAPPWEHEPRDAPPSMIYTSGTTGRPKGVQRFSPLDMTNPDLAAQMGWLGVAPGMRTVACGPMYHSAPNVFALLAGRTGGLVVFQSKFEPEALLGLVERYAIDALHLVPTMMIRLLRLPEKVRNTYDLSSLRSITHAAAPCPPEIKRACIDWFGPIVNEYYGGTETGVVVACDSNQWLAHPGTVGRPLGGAEVRVLGDDGRLLGPGDVGEIYIWNGAAGDFTYHNRDEKRRAIERDGLVTVGDVGYFDEDGFLYVCDRSTDMIISGGVNIYPAEIEAELHLHPDIADCAVFGIPDDEYGESVAAVIELQQGRTADADAIKTWLRDRLAGFKVPRLVKFGTDLPREDSGKIFKRKLRDEYWPSQDR
ncbi:AMP-binding protein [Mycobacterium sp.]|uniref:AMP-binding protein n=1 Tax=Mycobacterium sp. TaxID=1785 RepID=UPI003D6BC97A